MHPLEDAAHQMISYWNEHVEKNFERHCGSLLSAWLLIKMERPNPFGIWKNPSHDLSILALESCVGSSHESVRPHELIFLCLCS